MNGRIEKYNTKYGLAYGRDHALGLFVQVWKLDPHYPASHMTNMPDVDNILVDRDQFQANLTIEEIARIASGYGFDLSDEIPEGEIQI